MWKSCPITNICYFTSSSARIANYTEQTSYPLIGYIPVYVHMYLFHLSTIQPYDEYQLNNQEKIDALPHYTISKFTIGSL